MKTYKHLYEKFISKENIRLCINKAAKGKRKSKEVQKVLSNVDFRTLRYKMSKYDKERNEQYDRLCICG